MLTTEMLESILAYTKALDAARQSVDEQKCSLYVNGPIAVMYDGEQIGTLNDEDGLGWDYRPVNQQETKT